jgi:hypothetical protein
MPTRLEPHQFARSALGLNIYPWQAETLAAVGKGFPTALCAVNGSGKSSTVISALLIWFLSEFPAGRCIITSGSWSQLKAQVFDSARRFSDLPICRGWEFLDASIKTPGGGFCLGISVDEAFRAEGYHQREGSPVLLIIDEAKAVADAVFESFAKCTPTFKLITSSAGPASGRFYRYFSSESAYWFRRKVAYRECPHMNDQQRLADLEVYGLHSTFYRNRWLSEFATDAGEAVISLDALRDCLSHPPQWVSPNYITAGCDFAAGGGDSCCFSVARGNKLSIVKDWRHQNPNHSAGQFITLFRAHQPPLSGSQISGDAGGLGVGFLWDLEEAGFRIQPIHNGSPAKRDDLYANIAAEWWDNFNILVTKHAVILPDNERLLQQLSNRRREYDKNARIKLEAKSDMKARGADSPDLADSLIMACMTGWGGLPSSLNPAGDKWFRDALKMCANATPRNPFAVP